LLFGAQPRPVCVPHSVDVEADDETLAAGESDDAPPDPPPHPHAHGTSAAIAVVTNAPFRMSLPSVERAYAAKMRKQ
jgi:hypothetical protein